MAKDYHARPDILIKDMVQVIQLALLNMFLHVIWCLKSLGFDDPDKAGISSLKSKRDILVKQLDAFAESTLSSYKHGNTRSRLGCTVCQEIENCVYACILHFLII